MTDKRGGHEWSEIFRLITPVMLFVIGIYINSVKSDIGRVEQKVIEIDAKMFKHLTNDELHAPRSIVVTKPEFDIYQQMRNRQMDAVEKALCEIREMIRAKRM